MNYLSVGLDDTLPIPNHLMSRLSEISSITSTRISLIIARILSTVTYLTINSNLSISGRCYILNYRDIFSWLEI